METVNPLPVNEPTINLVLLTESLTDVFSNANTGTTLFLLYSISCYSSTPMARGTPPVKGTGYISIYFGCFLVMIYQ